MPFFLHDTHDTGLVLVVFFCSSIRKINVLRCTSVQKEQRGKKNDKLWMKCNFRVRIIRKKIVFFFFQTLLFHKDFSRMMLPNTHTWHMLGIHMLQFWRPRHHCKLMVMAARTMPLSLGVGRCVESGVLLYRSPCAARTRGRQKAPLSCSYTKPSNEPSSDFKFAAFFFLQQFPDILVVYNGFLGRQATF